VKVVGYSCAALDKISTDIRVARSSAIAELPVIITHKLSLPCKRKVERQNSILYV